MVVRSKIRQVVLKRPMRSARTPAAYRPRAEPLEKGKVSDGVEGREEIG